MIDNNTILNALQLSSLVYEDEKNIIIAGLTKIKYIINEHTDTRGVIMADNVNKKLYIAFKGTSSKDNLITDLECIQNEVTVDGKKCKIHDGFYDAYKSIQNEIVFNYPDYDIITCGHSLGGALATICGIYIASDKIYTVSFGSPRVGDSKFVKIFNSKVKEYYRFVHDNDVVPMVPKINYKHAGKQFRLDDAGNVISYINLWKRILYWIKSKKHFSFDLFSIKDHFMDNYIRVVALWVQKQK